MRQICDICGHFYEVESGEEDDHHYMCNDCLWDSTCGDGLDADEWEQDQ